MLFRRITESSAWKKAQHEARLGPSITPLIPLVISEFTPRVKDHGGLSVYECPNDRAELAKLGAAIGASLTSYDKGSTFFLGVEEEVLVARGLKVKRTPGESGHRYFDTQHLEIIIETDEAIVQAARAFVDGAAYEIMGPVISKTLRNEFVAGNFDFRPAAKKGPEAAMSRLGLKLVGEGIASLEPVPAVS